MNARNPKKAEQLKAMLVLLHRRGKGGATTWELAKVGGSCAPSTCISEIRANGYNVQCTREDYAEGQRIYRYRLIG